MPIELLRYLRGLYSKLNKNKPRDNLKYLTYYMLL